MNEQIVLLFILAMGVCMAVFAPAMPNGDKYDHHGNIKDPLS